MEHHQAGMANKWQRHFLGTKTTISYALILAGISIAIPMIILYPQLFNVDVFNSRLEKQLVLLDQDYLSCTHEYFAFISDEPEPNVGLYSFYLFNITNAADVFQRGNEPSIVEVGPFSYLKRTYKYDVSFDPTDSSTVTFKEYVILEPATDPTICVKMFHILDKDFEKLNDPCSTGNCDCKNPNEPIFVVNSVFMKLIWQESSQEVLARYSSAVFFTIKNLLVGEFVTAVKMHLVRLAYQEIFFFRQLNQLGPILLHGFNYLKHNTSTTPLTNQQISTMMLSSPSQVPSSCDLGVFGLSGCPFDVRVQLDIIKSTRVMPAGFTSNDFPSVASFFNSSGFLNMFEFEYSLPRLFGIIYCMGVANFNANTGYTMMNDAECKSFVNQTLTTLARDSFGDNPTSNQLYGTTLMAQAFLTMLSKWSDIYTDYLNTQTYLEFINTYSPVTCSPLGMKCMWQWGYMKKYYHNDAAISTELAYNLIDFRSSGNTNPNSFIFDANSGPKYNAYKYCTIVKANPVNYDKCLNISYTFNDGSRNQPAALWGVDHGVTAINRTKLYSEFMQENTIVRDHYIDFSCNLTILMFEVYPTITEFHDNFVIRYLNRKKDPEFTHNFQVGKWDDLGYAQWGGGFVTWALMNVRSIVQVLRNGMWVIGEEAYVDELMEFSSWCLYNAYPQSWIYNVTQAQSLLTALSRKDTEGVAFKKFIVEKATTFVGDGSNYVNGVGAVGEVTFITEQNLANYSCTGDLSAACDVLAVFYSSSNVSCNAVQNTYDICLKQGYTGNNWVTNCNRFETAITAPSSGVQCDNQMVYLHPHPYIESRGTITYAMLLQLTVHLILQRGLWCSNFDNCLFNMGGLFIQTSVKQVLFEGYTDPSVLQFLNLKHESDQINFYCAEGSVDGCGKSNLKCNKHGIMMSLPNGKSKLLLYNSTPNDEFFAPFFEVTSNGDMLWRHAIDPVVANASRVRALHEPVVRVFNPMWAAYPAWQSGDVAFNKYLQCQKRYFGGMPGLYYNCEDTLDTGAIYVNQSFNLKKFMGNDSIKYFNSHFPVNGSTLPNFQSPMYLWDGFASYPYSYILQNSNFFSLTSLSLFDKKFGLSFKLSQDSLLFEFEKDITINFPVRDTYDAVGHPISLSASVRRFVEDQNSWDAYTLHGKPVDSYGMPYIVPIGMASLERTANFPVFVGTVHCWGNEAWGGHEHSDVVGYVSDTNAQRTYSDYEPVTGKSFRTAIRQQVMIRIERGPLTPNIISSQQRCAVPSKSLNGGMGYGCFAYVPLFWTEDSTVQVAESYFKLHDHFYSRPERAATITYIGTAFCIVLVIAGVSIYIFEQFKRKKFMSRVYIDG